MGKSLAFFIFKMGKNYRHFGQKIAPPYSRLVFPSNHKQATVSVEVHQSTVPLLIQSWVSTLDGQPSGAFLVSPPLFRLDDGSTLLRVVNLNVSPLPTNKESLFYLNVKAIPGAVSADASPRAATDSTPRLVFAINQRIKLIYRPAQLQSAAADGFRQLTASTDNRGRLLLTNTGAYYVTLHTVMVGQDNLLNDKANQQTTLPPFSQQTYRMSGTKPPSISYTAIDDYGAETAAVTLSLLNKTQGKLSAAE